MRHCVLWVFALTSFFIQGLIMKNLCTFENNTNFTLTFKTNSHLLCCLDNGLDAMGFL